MIDSCSSYVRRKISQNWEARKSESSNRATQPWIHANPHANYGTNTTRCRIKKIANIGKDLYSKQQNKARLSPLGVTHNERNREQGIENKNFNLSESCIMEYTISELLGWNFYSLFPIPFIERSPLRMLRHCYRECPKTSRSIYEAHHIQWAQKIFVQRENIF